MTSSGDYYRALVGGRQHGLWPRLACGGLWLASQPYGLAMRARNWLYDRGWKRSFRVPVPVVSIGNLTLGGTGKTPCVEYVAGYYRRDELRVAILSRGYGSETGRNDEARVLEENLPDVPHLQGPDRVALAYAAIEELESEVLVLDDGFQHRRLARDLDIVLIDATQPWGYGYLFPRGLLRESPAGLRRGGVVVLTRCDQADTEQRSALRQAIRRLAPHASVVETIHQPRDLYTSDGATADAELLRGRPVAAFCGLGNPDAFRRTLERLRAAIVAFRTFPDHHPYSRSDVADLRTWAEQQPADCVVVTTQKDLVKIRLTRLGGRDLFALRIGLAFQDGQEALNDKLQSVVSTS